MPPSFRNADHLSAALAALAEEVRLKIIPLDYVQRTRLVTRLIADHDMIFGVWPDANQPEGFGVEVIKGADLMPPLDGFELPDEIAVAAIPCVGCNQAIAAREAWGRTDDEGVQEVEAPSSARVALSVAEVARLAWAAGRRPDAANEG